MHGLHNMIYFERKKNIHAVFFTVLLRENSSMTMFFFLSYQISFFFFWKDFNYCHKMYVET